MADPNQETTASPLKDGAHSIYAYQTRLLRNANGESPPSTPTGTGSISSHRGLSRMSSLRDETTMGSLRRAASGARIGTHSRAGKSVDLARGQWEAKIEAAATVGGETTSTTPPPSRPRSMMMNSPPSRLGYTSPSGAASSRDSPFSSVRNNTIRRDRPMTMHTDSPGWTGVRDESPKDGEPANGLPSADEKKADARPEPELAPSAPIPRARPPSTSALNDFQPLAPNDTGLSTASGKNVADTLAEARANALRRLQAKKAAGIAVGIPKVDLPPEIPIPPVEIKEIPPHKVSTLGPKISSSPLAASPTPTPKATPAVTPEPAAIPTRTAKAELPALPSEAPLPKLPTNIQALPTPTQDTAKSSPFGERLRPVSRIEDKTPVSPASNASPFGEKITLKKPTEVAPAEPSKSDTPTLRKTRSVDVGASTTPPSKLLPRPDYVQPSVPVLRRARSIVEGRSESPSKLLPKDFAIKSNVAASIASIEAPSPSKPQPKELDLKSNVAASIASIEAPSPSKPQSKELDLKSNVAASIASLEAPSPSKPQRKELGLKSNVAASIASIEEPPAQTSQPPQPIDAFMVDRLRNALPQLSTEAKTPTLQTSALPDAETSTPRAPKPSPFKNDVFSSPKASPAPGSPAKWANLGFRAPTAPPKGSVSALASRFAAPPISGSPAPRGRVPSLSSDRRQLGKHLPRIVSGDPGWEGDSTRKVSAKVTGNRERKASVTRPEGENTPPMPSKEEPSTPVKSRQSPAPSPAHHTPTTSTPRVAPLTPSHTVNREPASRISSIASTKSTPKSALLSSLSAPRAEVQGEAMKDLMSVISAAPARNSTTDGAAGVAGMSSRLKLSQTQRLPLAASSATLAPAPLPSRRLVNNNSWMDRQRHALAAYEYLCHVGEAQQWIEGCLDEELEFGVTEMEEGLRDGVVLAKLSRVFQGEHVVRRIWTEAKHRYRQSDNINYFLMFVRQVGMPETFIFELTDLYNKKNIPKVIFCIHVLSHLLARLGRAERMNNLLGQFEFTDEQLEATQKGIQGVAMPNFQQVGQTLAKEANFEPEPEEEIETEDEIRDRLLLEREDSIIALQRHLRGVLARQNATRVKAQLKLAAPIVVQIQSVLRGKMSRHTRQKEKTSHSQLGDWASALQAVSRGHLVRQSWQARVNRVRSTSGVIVGVQAQVRGMLARLRRSARENELDRLTKNVAHLQAACRGCLVRRDHKANKKALANPSVVQSVTSMQALLRAQLSRAKIAQEQKAVEAHAATFTKLQGHLRSALVRRQHKAREKKMDDATDYIVAIQAVSRGILARRRKQVFTKEVVTVSTQVVSFQALARARLAKKTHENMQKALAKVEIAGSVGGLQAFLRTKLAKRQTVEQKKRLEFVQPDVIGFQAVARGFIARQEYREWRDYLHDPHTQGALVFLQSLVRGFIARRRYWMRIAYLHRNVDKIVKIQAIWRGRTQRQMYDRLITGVGVDVLTIQNYMHLLDDTENDFRDQLLIDTLRKEVVELLRANQTLETEVQELDTKIALILKNKMSFEDLVRAKRRHGPSTGDESFHPPGGGDPFTNVHLDRTSQRKLELFEHLFFTLQTQPTYLCRLLHKLAADPELEKERRLVEGVTLILFGFGHDRREEYLFHKLVQISVHEQILRARSLDELAETRFAIIPVATQFVKPLLTPYLQNVLYTHVERVLKSSELDLSTDPVEIYNRIINAEESLTGMRSILPRDLTADQILQTHGETRTLYIQHLQELRALTDLLAKAVMAATVQVPYTVRLIAREALFACRVRFQDEPDSVLWPVVAKTVILPFILPAIVAPETYGIAESVNPIQRRNLTAIANLFTHVAAQGFSRAEKDRLVRVPLDEYIRAEGRRMGDWVLDVAEVDFHNQEMLESTSEATPISITRNDIYGLLGVLVRNVPALTAGKAGDPIESVLNELEGPPLEYDRGKSTVRVRLTNRLAQLQPSDPYQAQLREMEVQAKRHVLAVLRVQSGKDLYEVLLKHPTEEDEARWVYEVHRDIALEQARLARHDLPPTPAEAEYQMESIRSMRFKEVKSRAIEFCMALVEHGRLERDDQFQGLLVSIASDIKEKHRLRQKRRVDLDAMNKAHAHLTEKRQKFEEQIQSYHDYIDSAMAALQQKKKAPFMSKQYWHQRRGGGKKSKFGSYKYTAAELYEKGILLSVNQFSPRQFDKIHVVIKSDDVGVFVLEMSHPTGNGVLGREELRMEDLLQAQFDNNVRLDLFDGMAAFNLNMLIHQINKKFYAS